MTTRRLDLVHIKLLTYPRIVPVAIISNAGSMISFKPVTEVDSSSVLKSRNTSHVLKAINGRPISLQEHQNFILSYNSAPRIDFVLYDESNKEVIGGLNVVETKHGIEIGKYIASTKHLGQGIGKKASASFLEYLKLVLGKGVKVYSKTKKDNFVNIALNESLGFRILHNLDDSFLLMEKLL